MVGSGSLENQKTWMSLAICLFGYQSRPRFEDTPEIRAKPSSFYRCLEASPFGAGLGSPIHRPSRLELLFSFLGCNHHRDGALQVQTWLLRMQPSQGSGHRGSPLSANIAIFDLWLATPLLSVQPSQGSGHRCSPLSTNIVIVSIWLAILSS